MSCPVEKTPPRKASRSWFAPPGIGRILQLTLLGCLVGVLSGFAAILFRLLIAIFHNFTFCGRFSLEYDSLRPETQTPWGIGILLFPVLGAVVVTFLTRTFSPDARSHGVTDVMDAIYYGGGKLNPLLAPVKMLTSAISIGTGGSIGREGPMIHISAALGAAAAAILRLHLAHRERSLLLAAAAAGGVAGAFNTPMTGILLALELLLPSISAVTLLPVTCSAVVSSMTVRAIFGYEMVLPIAEIPGIRYGEFMQAFPGLLILGGLCGVCSSAFILGITGTELFFNIKFKNPYFRHGFGMLMVGLEFYLYWKLFGAFYLEGLGYSMMDALLGGNFTSIVLLLLLAAGKYSATCFSLGSGGSGGVMCPALFLGAVLGALVGEFGNLLMPGVFPVPRALLILGGMSAMVSGTTGAMVSGIIMVSELTGNYQIMVSSSIVVVIAFSVRRMFFGSGIYARKLRQSGHPVPESLQSSVWTAQCAADVMLKTEVPPENGHWTSVDEADSFDTVLRKWDSAKADGVLVLRNGAVVGKIDDRILRENCCRIAGRIL